MADLDTIQSTSEQRHAERIAASDQGFGDSPVSPPVDEPIDQPAKNPDGAVADPDLEPLGVHSIHKRLKEAKPVATTVQGHLVADADKAIEHLLSLIRYVMNSDGEAPRCTEATRTYLRRHLDF